MKRHDILFRSPEVTNPLIRRNILNFFKRTNLLKSSFIKLSISLNSGKEVTILVKDSFINRTVKEEINTLIRNLIDSLAINQISLKTRDRITIFYTESDSESYFNYQNSFKAYGRRFYSSLRRTSLARSFYSSQASNSVFKFINLAYPISVSDFNLTEITKQFITELKGLNYVSVIATNNFLLSLLLNGLIIFIFSFILNFILFYSVTLNLFGVNMKAKFINKFNDNRHLYFIIPFMVSFLIINYLSSSIILLDNVKVIVDRGDGELVFSGEFIKLLITQLGSAAVFSASARIAAGLVAKFGSNLSLMPKIGVIGATSTGFTATYVAVTKYIPTPSDGVSVNSKFRVVFELSDKDSTTANLLKNEEGKAIINKWLNDSGFSKINQVSSYTVNKTNDSQEIIVKMNKAESSRVVEELERTNPNWFDNFINSPLEKGDLLNSPFLQSINELIQVNLLLHFIILYLLIMLVFIFSCKVIIDNNINLDKTLSFPLGKYIHKFLNFYVNIWRKTANFWIFFILFCLIIFNCGIVISLYNILSVIQ